MIASKPPFRANNHIELLRKIESRNGPNWNDIIVQDSLKDLVNGLLKKNPLERMSFEEFFLHPCVVNKSQTSVDKIIETNQSINQTINDLSYQTPQQELGDNDSPFPGYGVNSKIFDSLRNSFKISGKDKFDFPLVKPISASMKWLQEKKILLTCPWSQSVTMDVGVLSKSDEGMIFVFALQISCLEELIFSEFIPAADSSHDWSIVLDLCLLVLDLYQICLDNCRSFFKSHRSISKDLKDLCYWIVSRTSILVEKAEHSSSLLPDVIDWDPPLILKLIYDKISSSLDANHHPSSYLVLSCLATMLHRDAYCVSIASRHPAEFFNGLHSRLFELNDVYRLS